MWRSKTHFSWTWARQCLCSKNWRDISIPTLLPKTNNFNLDTVKWIVSMTKSTATLTSNSQCKQPNERYEIRQFVRYPISEFRPLHVLDLDQKAAHFQMVKHVLYSLNLQTVGAWIDWMYPLVWKKGLASKGSVLYKTAKGDLGLNEETTAPLKFSNIYPPHFLVFYYLSQTLPIIGIPNPTGWLGLLHSLR